MFALRLPCRRPTVLRGSQTWARAIVATIPLRELPGSALTFAESAMRTTNPKTRDQHWAKFRAAVERLEREVSDR